MLGAAISIGGTTVSLSQSQLANIGGGGYYVDAPVDPRTISKDDLSFGKWGWMTAPGVIGINTTNFHFGAPPTGTTTMRRTLTLTNNGMLPLTVTGINLTNAPSNPFTIVSQPSLPLVLQPIGAGVSTATIVVQCDIAAGGLLADPSTPDPFGVAGTSGAYLAIVSDSYGDPNWTVSCPFSYGRQDLFTWDHTAGTTDTWFNPAAWTPTASAAEGITATTPWATGGGPNQEDLVWIKSGGVQRTAGSLRVSGWPGVDSRNDGCTSLTMTSGELILSNSTSNINFTIGFGRPPDGVTPGNPARMRMIDGTIKCKSNYTIGEGGGRQGTGEQIVTNGVITCGGTFTVGSSSTGTLTMTNGSISASGANNTANNSVIANDRGVLGVLNLGNGSLNCKTLYIRNGHGILNIPTGSLTTIAGGILCGFNTSGGLPTGTGEINLGLISNPSSAASITAAGPLALAGTTGISSATLNFMSGSLTASSLLSSGTIVWSAGTMAINNNVDVITTLTNNAGTFSPGGVNSAVTNTFHKGGYEQKSVATALMQVDATTGLADKILLTSPIGKAKMAGSMVVSVINGSQQFNGSWKLVEATNGATVDASALNVVLPSGSGWSVAKDSQSVTLSFGGGVTAANEWTLY